MKNQVTLKWLGFRSLFLTTIVGLGAVAFIAVGGTTPPSIPTVALSADPLYATSIGDKPALALALSVEYPTVGAQYVDQPRATSDNTYSNTKEYLGYYDAESCYIYNNAPTETPVAPFVASDYKRFDRIGLAIALTTPVASQPTLTSRKCANAFSGNFLNWASSSAIDMLRLALTGGDRYIDTPNLTVLQRAVLPNGDPVCMWNSSNFPAKQLMQSGGTSGAAYFGAVPTSMQTAAGGDIWVANTLNKIYFGTSKTGDCTNTGSYTLGQAPASSNAMGAITNSNTVLPGGSTECASENGTCSGFTGTKEIWYGANSSWKVAPATGSVSCSNATFGDPLVGTLKKCYHKNYDGTWASPSTNGLNTEGFFYSRVQVCNVDSAGVLLDARDYGLCKPYPSGNYKPTGAIQKYSDQLRLAAFGYLMDQTPSYNTGGRYGGVLRAPMKYVGTKTFDVNGVEDTPVAGNPNKEWNQSTGVFLTNPDGNSTTQSSTGTYLSGVITYLNQFGRIGPTPGLYKKFDPVGELHYEALRYLQGLQPSADAISGITATNKAALYDGFPVTTTWTDPYASRPNTSDYACLKSNIVVIGDVNTHDGGRLPTASAASNIPDIAHWRSIVQSFETNGAAAYIDGQGASRTTSNPNGSNGSVPTNPGTSQIMGSAYWARTHDIRGTGWTGSVAQQRPGLRVKTYTFDVNEYGEQTPASTRRTANQLFMAAKYGGFETDAINQGTNPLASSASVKPQNNPWNTWGNPFKHEDGQANRYVWEETSSSRAGEASAYYLQSDARGVLSAFDSIFAGAAAARSIAGVAIQSQSLTPAGSTAYQGAFEPTDWSGNLLAFPISVSQSNVVTVGTTPTWEAGVQLDTHLATRGNSRKIFVGNAGATKTPVAAAFEWDSIETDLQNHLKKASPSAAADTLGPDRLSFLRGDNAKAGTVFRSRTKLLGDIVNSGAVYSGAPSTSISADTYKAFVTANAARTPAVFVGANDGMLHAFNANNGAELFAYIPSWMGPKLSALTSSNYLRNHQSYVDGTPAVAEAEVTTATGTAWQSVLVSGTGGGGKGVFALDISNPATFNQDKVMWEFTHDDDPDMGNVVGRPQILKFRTSSRTAVPATYKWFAVVGSGVNSYSVTNSAGNYGSGYPALFLLDLSKAKGAAWVLGENYYKISLPVNGNLDYLTTGSLTASKATGVINFSAALGVAREVTKIYTGDLQGNLWKLNFSLLGADNWNVNKLSFFKNTALVPYPLFIAKDTTGNVQPITMAPISAFGPTEDTSYVLFGTGKYLEKSDVVTTGQQSFYMIYDNASTTADSSPAGASAVSGRGRLQTGTSSAGVVTVPAFTLGRPRTDGDVTQRSGWVFNYPNTGDRQISNAKVFGSSIIFSSLNPGISGGSGSCLKGGGDTYTIDIAAGNGVYVNSTSGITAESLVVDIPSAATYTISDSTGRRTKTTPATVITPGSNTISVSGTASKTQIVGRLSWRQIHNYQDLK